MHTFFCGNNPTHTPIQCHIQRFVLMVSPTLSLLVSYWLTIVNGMTQPSCSMSGITFVATTISAKLVTGSILCY